MTKCVACRCIADITTIRNDYAALLDIAEAAMDYAKGEGRGGDPMNEQQKPVDMDALERMRDATVQNSLINWDAFRRYRDEVMAVSDKLFSELRYLRSAIDRRDDAAEAAHSAAMDRESELRAARETIAMLTASADRDNDIALGLMDQRDAAKAENARLREVLERVYPYFEAVNHVHMPDGSILYASELWAVLAATAKPETPATDPWPKTGIAEAMMHGALLSDPDGMGMASEADVPKPGWIAKYRRRFRHEELA